MAASDRLALYGSDQPLSPAALVERHGLLIKRIAHHLLGRLPASVQLEDLLQAGVIGLLEAARNYDAAKGASFETYAGIRIRGAMIDEVRRGDWAPRSVHRNARRVQQAALEVERREARDASDIEIAAELGVELDEYHAMTRDSMGSRLFSLDELAIGDDRNEEVVPSADPGPEELVQGGAFRASLAQAISELPERERLVLSLYYDDELNLKEIGLVLGVSESRVCQIHSQAAGRLRQRLADWRAGSR